MRGRLQALLAAFVCALALTLATPAAAHALAIRAASPMTLTADVAVETTASDPAGLGLLYVDGGLASSVAIRPSEPATFAGVRFEPGEHTLRVFVRSRTGVSASAVTTVGCWGTPPPPVPTLVRGLYPATAGFPVYVAGASRLTVYVDGARVSSKAVGTPSTTAVSFGLTPGAHTVVLRAENPLASSSTTLTVTRPIWPVPGCTRITSYFGWRIHPILGTRRFHAGLDIAAPSGARVVATGPATVRLAGVNGGYGNCVILDHGGGVTTLHGHLSRIDVKVGQRVSVGQRIGLVGSTGLSTGPHLHYEIQRDGAPQDPLGYL